MGTSPGQLVRNVLARFRGKALKFTAVSGVGTVVGQSTLIVTHAGLGWAAVPSNLTAVTLGAIPSYLLNRYWVWGKRGANSLRREVLPFWLMTLAGLALSTVFVWLAERVNDATIVIMGANVAGFGLLWVFKFLVLDAVLFAPQPAQTLEGP